MTKAVDNTNIALAVVRLRLPNFAAAKKPANSANNTAKVNSPPPIVSASILPSSFNAPAITINATPNITRPLAVRPSFAPTPSNFLTAVTINPNTTANPTSPVTISPILIVDRTFKAPARTNIATDILINDVATPNVFLIPPTLAIAM